MEILDEYPTSGGGRPFRSVMCHGVFDLLHLGHIRHLQEAAKLGDYLIVSVTADKHVKKGIGRPHFTAEQRMEMLRALDCVDEVILCEEPGPWELMRKLKPSFYVKGVDYVGKHDYGIDKDREVAAEVGIQMRFTGSRKWSSSQLINYEKFSSDVCGYLKKLKDMDAKDKILEAFDKADDKAIIFVGETIYDEYKYVYGLGRASKELMLATVELGRELFTGGVRASAKHGEWKRTAVLTQQKPLTKTRYVDVDFKKKLFDVYSSREIFMSPEEREIFRQELTDAVVDADILIVNDFGHGLLGKMERDMVQNTKFLALNTQTNAGNYGFNLVTGYKNANFVCIDDPEARLAANMKTAAMPEVVSELFKRQRCRKYVVTHGRYGSMWFNGSTHGSSPALAEGGIDTMGAGDAVMAVIAPLIAVGLDMEIASFVGNIVGAIKISILGHQRHVGRDEIIQTVEALLA